MGDFISIVAKSTYMKILFYMVLGYILLAAIPANSAILILHPDGTYTTEKSLTSAAKSSVSAGNKIVITSVCTITTTINWPADRKLEIEKGGLLIFSGSGSLHFNSGASFVANQYQVFAGTGAVSFDSGTVSEVHPEWWGAKADNSTDSTSALLSALNCGENVSFSSGTYLISSTITLTTSNVIYTGKGIGKTTIKLKSDSNPTTGMFLYYTPANNFMWRDLTFDYNGSNNILVAGKIFDIRGAHNFSFIDCEFTNVVTGLKDYSKASYAVILDGCLGLAAYQNIFDSCRFYNFETGGIYQTQLNTSQAKSGDNLTIRNCFFAKGRRMGNNTSSAIWIVRNPIITKRSGSNNTIIEGCRFEDIDDSAVIGNGFNGLTIANCYGATKGTSIYLGSVATTQNNFNMTNCEFSSKGGLDVALILANVSNFTVSNSQFYGCDYEGMRCESSSYGTITGCLFYNNGASGSHGVGLKMSITGSLHPSKYISVTGCTFYNTTPEVSRSQVHGIVSANNSDYLTIVGNNFYNLTGDAVIIEVANNNLVQNCTINNNSVGSQNVNSTNNLILDWFFYKNRQIRLEDDVRSITMQNAQSGDVIILQVLQLGNHKITGWPSNIYWIGGTAPTISSEIKYYTFTFYYDNSRKVYVEINRAQSTN